MSTLLGIVALSVGLPLGFLNAQIDGGARVFSAGGSSSSSSEYGSLGYGLGSGATQENSLQSSFLSNYQNTSAGSGIGHPSTATLLAQNPTPVPVSTSNSTILPGAGSTTGTSSFFLQPMDPYGTPNQSSLFSGNGVAVGSSAPNTGSNSVSVYSGNFERFVPETYEAMRRFREATSVEFTFLPRGKKTKNDSFGMDELDLRMMLAVPCRFIPNNGTGQSGSGYFYIAPGANLVWWSGPKGPPHMSPNGFGAYVDVGMQPQFNDVFAVDAWFRFGVYSDFKKVKSDAIRFQGKAAGIFTVSPDIKIVAGVMYLHRERIKILPTGGVIWTPRDDWILRLTFPNPKISKRLWTGDRAEWWGYVNADYGGDSWYVQDLGKTDYNDIRVGIGIEFETHSRVNGYFELGGSFNRELYSRNRKWASPSDVIYFKTGIMF